MRRLPGLAGACALLASLALSGAAHAADACRMVKAGELPVRFEHDRPMVQMAFNGHPAWMLVDTGAASTLMFGGAMRELGLKASSVAQGMRGMRFYGVGGGQDVLTTEVAHLNAPGLDVRDVRFFVIGAQGGVQFAGVLGRDLLGAWDLEFDLAAKVVRLWSPQACGDRNLAYWTQEPDVADLRQAGRDGEYVLAIALNGRAARAVLDSGAQVTALTPSAARLAGAVTVDAPAGSGMHGIGETRVAAHLATLAAVQIGAETVKDAHVMVADMFAADTEATTGSMLDHPAEGLRSPEMLLGADFLRAHRVLIAPGQHRFYFSYLGGPVFQPHSPG